MCAIFQATKSDQKRKSFKCAITCSWCNLNCKWSIAMTVSTSIRPVRWVTALYHTDGSQDAQNFLRNVQIWGRSLVWHICVVQESARQADHSSSANQHAMWASSLGSRVPSGWFIMVVLPWIYRLAWQLQWHTMNKLLHI